MKTLTNLFVSLLFIAFVIILSGCDSTSYEVSTQPTSVTASVQHIEIEETKPLVTETLCTEETEHLEDHITFEFSYIDSSDVMPYALVSPSVVDEDTSIPLIVSTANSVISYIKRLLFSSPYFAKTLLSDHNGLCMPKPIPHSFSEHTATATCQAPVR